jgi:hypothetical protein
MMVDRILRFEHISEGNKAAIQNIGARVSCIQNSMYTKPGTGISRALVYMPLLQAVASRSIDGSDGVN